MSADTITVDSNGDVIEGTALEAYQPAPPPPALFGTTDPVEVVQRAAAVADALKDVIIQGGLYQNIQGKSHVKVEGWQLLGSMLGVTAVCVATEQVENGWKATVEARTADGRVIGRADALCTKDEKRGPWKTADEYARLSMAQTRATSKALKGPLGFVISMAGYQTTPAEEMPNEPQSTPEPPAEPPKPQLPEERVQELLAAIKEAKRPQDWLRMQLVAVGASDVPEGRLKKSTLHNLTDEQASSLLAVCAMAVEDDKAATT